jgi:hypothetical protein
MQFKSAIKKLKTIFSIDNVVAERTASIFVTPADIHRTEDLQFIRESLQNAPLPESFARIQPRLKEVKWYISAIRKQS